MDDEAELERSRRRRTLRVVVSADEADRIAKLAADADLSLSGYLRRVGLEDPPRPVLDQELILELVRINGDQGRLGGLLKLWLSSRPGEGASAFDVRRLLKEIEAVQDLLRQAIERL